LPPNGDYIEGPLMVTKICKIPLYRLVLMPWLVEFVAAFHFKD